MTLTGPFLSKKIKISLITISIVLFVLNASSVFNAYATKMVWRGTPHVGCVFGTTNVGTCESPFRSAAPAKNPIPNESYIPTPPTSILSPSGPTSGGAAISGAATGGAASTGSPSCYQGATCNFYAGQATSGAATGGSATGGSATDR